MFKEIEEYVTGAACANCWGSGKTFGDIDTPKRITITGSGFAGACAPCNDTFIAEQDVFAPCLWKFNNGTVLGSWTAGPLATLFQLEMVGGPVCYNQTGAKCAIVSTFGGATVTIDPVQPQTPEWNIAFDKNFSPNPDTVFLNLGAVNGDEVLILASRPDRVKLHVLYEPEY